MRYVPCSIRDMHTITALMTSVLILGLHLVSASAEQKPQTRAPLTLKLSTTLAPAPAQVTARISVEPDARSRALTVEWWSEDGAGGSHSVQLHGDQSAARQDFAIKRMEAGVYVVRAILMRNDGSVVRKESNLVIVGEGSRFSVDSRGNLFPETATSRDR
jgi:hypothetical protein